MYYLDELYYGIQVRLEPDLPSFAPLSDTSVTLDEAIEEARVRALITEQVTAMFRAAAIVSVNYKALADLLDAYAQVGFIEDLLAAVGGELLDESTHTEAGQVAAVCGLI